jgi:hypothetical protein
MKVVPLIFIAFAAFPAFALKVHPNSVDYSKGDSSQFFYLVNNSNAAITIDSITVYNAPPRVYYWDFSYYCMFVDSGKSKSQCGIYGSNQ